MKEVTNLDESQCVEKHTQHIELDRLDVPQLEHTIDCIFFGKFAKRIHRYMYLK